jgi:OmpA-OmpF porin, OOP family
MACIVSGACACPAGWPQRERRRTAGNTRNSRLPAVAAGRHDGISREPPAAAYDIQGKEALTMNARMQIKNIAIACAVGAVLCLGTVGAQAQPAAQPYFGGAIGSSDVDNAGSDTGFKLYGGFDFGKPSGFPLSLAGEISYLNFGKFRGGLKVDGFSFDIVPSLALNQQFDLFGRIGMARLTGKAGGFSESDTDVKFGLGAQYKFNRNWSLRGEAEFFDLETADVDFFSIGLRYDF